MQNEEWKSVEGIDHLEVSNLGRVRTVAHSRTMRNGRRLVVRERVRKPFVSPLGYLQLSATRHCKVFTRRVHRLVAIAFIPNPQGLPEVNHINGDKTDNRVENLEWATRSENVSHAYRTGLAETTLGTGTENINAKLSERDVQAIRSAYKGRGKGPTHRQLAERYGVTRSAVSRICRGEGWRHLK